MSPILSPGEALNHLGELFLVGVPDTELKPEVAERLRRMGPSGVIFFAANFTDAAGAARYTRAVHAVLGSPELPALVAADEEGGMVSQLARFWEVPPSARAVASSGGPPLVKDLAARTGRRLLALGVNLDFAPVVDIDSNPRNPVIGVRSFGSSPSQVTACGRAAIEGFQSVGVIPVAKHFPGHGDTSLDSHVALPRLDLTAEQLAMRELRPFEGAIQAGVPVIMTAHLLVPAIDADPSRTATLSPAIVTGLLRERLHFSGVVVTDALEMHGAATLGSHGEVAVRAIEAGVDLLLYSKLEPGPEEALAALRAALASGRLTAERVAASLTRIRSLRAASAARPPEFTGSLEREMRDLIPSPELDRIAEGAARLLKQGAGGIPLRQPVEVLEVNRPETRAPMADLLRAHGMVAREHGPDPESWPRRIEGSALLTVAARSTVSAEEEAVARAWLRRFPETITVASLNPHVTDDWTEVRTLLATFDNTPASRRALAKRVAGEGDSPKRGRTVPGGRSQAGGV
ncbi:MAG TPA: glycoside hydrolase family 3 protein [Candidatus Limnocylindrales bacterium]|nr:glycoside hydrolase family 3 protein [Candidatus Limnocylindrales bacterium]